MKVFNAAVHNVLSAFGRVHVSIQLPNWLFE